MILNMTNRRDLENYITDCMGEDGNDSATQVVLKAMLARADMPAYGAGHDAWASFLEPLDFWQIHEEMGRSFVPEICHPNNAGK
jgi:hypothetical protein